MTLEKILDSYMVESAETFYEEDLEDKILKHMPGYDVFVWDMDMYNFGQSVGDTLAAVIEGKTIVDVQTSTWKTEIQDCYVYVMAIKFKEDL